MALSRVKVWGSEILTAADLNSEFDNILNNPFSLISPVTSDITWNDSINATFGTGGDADIRYDGTDLLILPAVVGTGNLRISGGSLMTQDNEGVYFGTGDDARIYYDGTNMYFDSDVVGTGQFIFNAARMILLNDTSNSDMVVGITINQGTDGNHLFDGKSSSISTGLTTGTSLSNVEDDDWLVIARGSPSLGGVTMLALAEDAALAEVLQIEVIGGTAATTDTTASTGMMNIVISEHNGANATIAMPANSNAFTIQASTGAATYDTRLLLKADDGELHLGNTTLQALDEEDDIQAVRALQWANHRGHGMIVNPYEKPIYDFDALHRMGVVGERDSSGNFLIRVQPYLALHDGAIFQLATNFYALRDHVQQRLETIERKLLEA